MDAGGVDVRWCDGCNRTCTGEDVDTASECPSCSASAHRVWQWELVQALCSCPRLPAAPLPGITLPLEKGACPQVLRPPECPCPLSRVDGVGTRGCDESRAHGWPNRCDGQTRVVYSDSQGHETVAAQRQDS
jgi:hypothetical protein